MIRQLLTTIDPKELGVYKDPRDLHQHPEIRRKGMPKKILGSACDLTSIPVLASTEAP